MLRLGLGCYGLGLGFMELGIEGLGFSVRELGLLRLRLKLKLWLGIKS